MVAQTFTCLWCGARHTAPRRDDLEAWARLCPDCLGRAAENEFLRFRLRQAIEARGRAAEEGATVDDWYLRRGRYARGPVHDTAWAAELDAAGRWLDGLPISGDIVELAAGTGWWSPLLAAKGTLSAYDVAGAALDVARRRLVAHGLRAHLHVRDAWAEPEREVDALFTGFWLSHVAPERLAAFLVLTRRWLRPGGLYAAIDSLPDPPSGPAGTMPPGDEVQLQRLADGRAPHVREVHRSPSELAAALRRGGFSDVNATTTGRFFVLLSGRA